MKLTLLHYFFFCPVFLLIHPINAAGQNTGITLQKINPVIKKEVWTQDERDVKGTVEKFLVSAGNYGFQTIEEMVAKNANIGIARLREGNLIKRLSPRVTTRPGVAKSRNMYRSSIRRMVH